MGFASVPYVTRSHAVIYLMQPTVIAVTAAYSVLVNPNLFGVYAMFAAATVLMASIA